LDLKDFLIVMKDLGFDDLIIDNDLLNQKLKLLEDINKEIQVCTKCDLYKSRTQAVLGEGNPNSPIIFIGEAPGEEEDKQGRPFVGRAGQLLTKAIESAGYKRSDVYIANINKCRPPNNRTPTVEEQEACFPYLKRQIDIINPSVLCLLGATAYRGIFKKETKITKERGNTVDYKGKKVYVTYHPAYVLRNPKEESTFFEDIKKALDLAFIK
jgi:DNA polymerase